jgi:hypothetical protein
MKTKAVYWGLALLSLLFAYHISYADGFFIPKARKKMPNIPIQRALVKYQQGTEALIVESTLDGEGGDYGWIIPVPNPPKKFDKVSPGLLKTLSLQLQPKINHVEPHAKAFGIRFTSIITILIVITCFCIMRWGANGSLIPLIFLTMAFYMLPYFISYRGDADSSLIADPLIKVTSREIVGDYEVFVLDVQDGTMLNTWLEKNGFSKISPKAIKLVADYISRDWFFVVAKLRTTSDGIATPHPILLEFETDRPVYPMKLTAIPDSTVYLELFVVGENEAIPVNYSIKKEYCNFFDYGKIGKYRSSFASEAPTGFKPRKSLGRYMEIAHSDAFKVMWDGCVVTKFTGKISSREMTKDMFFQFMEAKPFRSELHSWIGKLNIAYHVSLIVLLIGSILLTIYYRVRKSLVSEISIRKLFKILVVSWVTAFVLTYALVGEKTDVYSVERHWRKNFQNRIASLFSEPQNTFSTGAELIELLQRKGIDNPITKEPIILEDSPGNIVVEKAAIIDQINQIKICLENGSLENWY